MLHERELTHPWEDSFIFSHNYWSRSMHYF